MSVSTLAPGISKTYTNRIALVPPGDPGSYKAPFLNSFMHLNVAMMTSNNALVPDPDKQDDLASKFWQWPILHVGLRMCSWDNQSKPTSLTLHNLLF